MICRPCDVSSTELACWVCGQPTTAGNLLTPVIPGYCAPVTDLAREVCLPAANYVWPSLRRNR